jgi:hypothetical protein
MKKPLMLLLAATFLLSACNTKTTPTPENFAAALNAWFPDHPDCLLTGSIHFPFETGDPVLIKQMDALTTAQILELHRAPMLHVTRYVLTPAGTRAGTHLCFGHREIKSIDSWTPPATANGFSETQVSYHYTLMDTPIWAKTPEVVAAFPKLAEELSGNATDRATLALTRVNWSVPD